MADQAKRSHIIIDGFSKTENYKYPKDIVVKFPKANRNRALHGKRILSELEKIKTQFQLESEVELHENIIREDAIYVEFTSDWGYKLKFEQLHDNSNNPKYQILNIREENNPDDETKQRYTVVMMLTKGGISHFIKKVNLYLNENTTDKKGNITDIPQANDLIANIENIQYATLKAFWTDSGCFAFPDEEESVWWEVWFRKSNKNEDIVIQQLDGIGAQIGQSKLIFAEHIVRLVKATATQLSKSVMLLDNLAELRKPQETNDFITHPSIQDSDKLSWMNDLSKRTELKLDENSVLICLLDSGVNNAHPLLNKVLPDSNLYAWKDAWGKLDTESNGGHGTGMAGLALYGDLTDALAHNHQIHILHGLESFKILHPTSKVDKELYGVIYQDACYTPLVDRPYNPRVFCLSVTNKEYIFRGRPSSSSAALDKIAVGNLADGLEPQLILVSGGNVNINKHEEFPNKNYYEDVHDPAQAYNAITVGSFTNKNKLVSDTFKPLALYGGMAPSNSTSATWETQWPNKPDIVMEGGNLATDGIEIKNEAALKPLSLDKEFPQYLFLPFGGTSASVALASKMAAELRTSYPDYWPETIRGLMIHSAEWTNEMLLGKNLSKEDHRRSILRSVGYGVPNKEKAIYSANNSLTLIAQNKIKPYRKEGSAIKYHEYHLFELPWPVDVLLNEIGDKDVTLKVTLSYFIEPNPGNRQYASNFQYHSHELDFKLIKPYEKLDEFKRRISASAAGTEEDRPNLQSEEWTIKERIRSKGSIKKDFITSSGAELSQRNKLAVYPKNGWYRTRPKKELFNSTVRYSLIVSIETQSNKIDIYTPVQTLVETKIKSLIEIPINQTKYTL
jgi:hypothetical protein